MEIPLNKRYPVAASSAQAWALLSNLQALAACMPGAEITEQLDDKRFKGQVRSKVGPGSLLFAGDIEQLACDATSQRLELVGKGSDKGGSAASMHLVAQIEPDGDHCILVGIATVSVSGKLAQIGSRLLAPASDALLAQFAKNFSTAAAVIAVPPPASAGIAPSPPAQAVQAPQAPQAPTPAELNALSLLWDALKRWCSKKLRR
jgi:uncharacterized protein